jgi:hypothetical protein
LSALEEKIIIRLHPEVGTESCWRQSKKKVFTVIMMRSKKFVSVAEAQQKLVLYSITAVAAGVKVQFQKAASLRVNRDSPGSYPIAHISGTFLLNWKIYFL